ncbi:MAG TPA: DMT family transporter [Burkholderiaceae bacterium]|nr:DMT family transporter [Burkholderiaceae bacterium]
MNSDARAPHWRAALQLLASMSLAGTYVALVKPLAVLLPIFALALLRFAIGAVALLPWSWRGRSEAPLTRLECRQLFLQSFFGNFLFSVCMLSGVALTSATAAGLVMSALPVVVALLSSVLLSERVTGRLLLAVGCAGAGIALVQLARSATPVAASSWLGNALVLGAVCCEAVYVVIGKQLSATRTPMRVSAWINLWGLALSAPLGLWQLARVDWVAIPARLWAYLVFYALAASVVTVPLWMSGLRRTSAGIAGVFTVALPLSATAVAAGVLGETVTWLHAVALSFAVLAIVLAAMPAGRFISKPD